jgi:hypothetical protein
MVGAEDVPRVEVQAVGCEPVRADAGIEMHLVAAQALSFGVNPPEQFAGEASSASGGHGGQIVNIYVRPQLKLVLSLKPATATASVPSSGNTPTSR